MLVLSHSKVFCRSCCTNDLSVVVSQPSSTTVAAVSAAASNDWKKFFVTPHDCPLHFAQLQGSVSSGRFHNCNFNIKASLPGNGTLELLAHEVNLAL